MNLSNNDVDYQMFRVRAEKLKGYLKEKAASIKDYLIKAVDAWCTERIIYIHNTYSHMDEEINKMPSNEKELVELRAFIMESKDVVQPSLAALHKDVEQHYAYHSLVLGA